MYIMVVVGWRKSSNVTVLEVYFIVKLCEQLLIIFFVLSSLFISSFFLVGLFFGVTLLEKDEVVEGTFGWVRC